MSISYIAKSVAEIMLALHLDGTAINDVSADPIKKLVAIACEHQNAQTRCTNTFYGPNFRATVATQRMFYVDQHERLNFTDAVAFVYTPTTVEEQVRVGIEESHIYDVQTRASFKKETPTKKYCVRQIIRNAHLSK